MKKQICLIHGGSAFSSYDAFINYLKTTPVRDPYYQGPKRRWKEFLYEELHINYDVLYPSMPNAHNAKYEEWKIWFERQFEYLTGHIILIGHSQGGIFLARYFSENKPEIDIDALILLAAPFPNVPMGVGESDDGGDFNFNPNQLENLGKYIENIYILHSKDDSVVPVSHGTKYKKALTSAEYVEFDDRGHFLQETFPEIIELIKNTK
jgi:predicted alpha/beta hydrolase family esterase